MFLSFPLEGKTALVTGASKGIGRDTALLLAQAGADVAVMSRSKEELDSLVEEIKKDGRKGIALPGDISRVNDIYAVVDQVMNEFGRIDILVNSAGINIRADVVDYTEETWDQVLDTNLKGMFFACQAVGKKSMIPQKKGKIINIASTMSFIGGSQRVAYASSKGGVLQLTKALAVEWACHNINVNGVAPGWTYTNMTEKVFQDKEKYEFALSTIPLKTIAKPRDISPAVLYLASTLSDCVTGHTIVVDGGWTVW